MTIGGLQRRVLDTAKTEHIFPLGPDVPSQPLLTFAIGVEPMPAGGSPRFEILLRSGSGVEVELYRRTISTSGWVGDRVDLRAHELTGARLVLRKTLVEGSDDRLLKSAWGNPTIIPARATVRTSVILISIDTLRADHLGAYGYPNARTPRLDGLAKGGVLYERAYSPASWTLPSHRSLLLGVYPGKWRAGQRPVAAVFREAGYLTAAFTGGGIMSTARKFDRGFDTFFAYQGSPTVGECPPDRFDGPEVFRRAIEWLRRYGRLPFFLFLHTYEVHDRCEFLPDGKLVARLPDPGPDGRKRLSGYYDDLIARVDDHLGALLRELDALGISESTLLVVTSDHGESLWEHGVFGHDCAIKPYEGLVHVPLILRYPSRIPQGSRVTNPVSIIAAAPTILELTGFAPEPSMPARPLPGLGLPGSAASAPVYSLCGDMLAVWDEHYKLIASRKGEFPEEVYDLEDDPLEKKNLAGRHLEIESRLRGHAAAYWNSLSAGAQKTPVIEGELDPKTRERMRVLGYLK